MAKKGAFRSSNTDVDSDSIFKKVIYIKYHFARPLEGWAEELFNGKQFTMDVT